MDTTATLATTAYLLTLIALAKGIIVIAAWIILGLILLAIMWGLSWCLASEWKQLDALDERMGAVPEITGGGMPSRSSTAVTHSRTYDTSLTHVPQSSSR